MHPTLNHFQSLKKTESQESKKGSLFSQLSIKYQHYAK